MSWENIYHHNTQIYVQCPDTNRNVSTQIRGVNDSERTPSNSSNLSNLWFKGNDDLAALSSFQDDPVSFPIQEDNLYEQANIVQYKESVQL